MSTSIAPQTGEPHRATGETVIERQALLSLRAVSKQFAAGADPAVSELSFDVMAGEFFALLGPSGSGKTTTLRMIAGFETPTQGRIELRGVDVTGTPPYKRDVSTVFQNYALFPHMDVAKNVEYPLRNRRVPKPERARRASEALDRVDMASGLRARLPHELSGGQRQRVALARALVSEPQVVLLDEPLGALDLRLREQMQVLLKQLQRDVGITFIYVTHDQGEALAMSDRMAVMDNGRMEQCGTPLDVYERPATRFVAGFIGHSNLLPCSVRSDGPNHIITLRGGAVLRSATAGPAGPDATVAIRYESVRVEPGDHGGGEPNRIAGVVSEILYLGDRCDVVVSSGGDRLVARISSSEARRLSSGDLVSAVIPPESVVLLNG